MEKIGCDLADVARYSLREKQGKGNQRAWPWILHNEIMLPEDKEKSEGRETEEEYRRQIG